MVSKRCNCKQFPKMQNAEVKAMIDAEKMQIEYSRVRDMMAAAISNIEETGGNVEFFGAGLLRAALEMHVELHGAKSLDKAISGIATRMLLDERGIRKC